MIKSFRSKDAERLHRSGVVTRLQGIASVARRKLRQLDSAEELRDLAIFPGSRLEPLKGDRAGPYSIRVNDQWWFCFRCRDGDAYDVEIVDYH